MVPIKPEIKNYRKVLYEELVISNTSWTPWTYFRRLSANNWEVLMGMSWESVTDDDELESIYKQKYYDEDASEEALYQPMHELYTLEEEDGYTENDPEYQDIVRELDDAEYILRNLN